MSNIYAQDISHIKYKYFKLMMEDKPFSSDQKLQAMLNRLKKEVPDIKCPQGNRVVKLCLNPKCKNALRCGNKECKNCGKALHKSCGEKSLEDVTQLVNQKAEGCREFVVKMCEIEERFIESIRKIQMRFIEQFGLDLSQQSDSALIKVIYEGKQYIPVSGEDVQKLVWTLEESQSEEVCKRSDYKLEKYKQNLDRLLQDYQYIKSKCKTSPLDRLIATKTPLFKPNPNAAKLFSGNVFFNQRQQPSLFGEVSLSPQVRDSPRTRTKRPVRIS